MPKTVGVWLIFVAVVLQSENATAGCRWEYIDASNTAGDAIVISRDPDFFSIGHMVKPIKFCKEGDKYICFMSGDFVFSVPTKIRPGMTWETDDFVFRSLYHEVTVVGSRNLSSIRIEAIKRHSEAVFVYSYSPEIGLIAIAMEAKAGASHLVNVNECGFGSKRKCCLASSPVK